MSSTNFQDYNQNTPIVSAWLNDVNKAVYGPVSGVPKLAAASAVAWIRFTVVGTVITTNQLYNVGAITRTGVGVYVIQYLTALPQSANCYSAALNEPGFVATTAESNASVTLTFTSAAGAPMDPGFASVVIFGGS